MTIAALLLFGGCFYEEAPRFKRIDCNNIAEFFDATVQRDRSRHAFDFVVAYQECGSRSLDFADEALMSDENT